jgi:hypothetical protein
MERGYPHGLVFKPGTARQRIIVQRRILVLERLVHPAGGRLFGPVFRPEVVLGTGDKAVDVVER